MKPQSPPVHVAVEFAGCGHGVQEVVPHDAGLVFEAQVLPHAWKPMLQLMPQLTPLQVAWPLSGTSHGVQELPQVFRLVLEAQ